MGSDHRKPARRRGARSQTARPGRPHALRGAKGDPRTRDIGIVVLTGSDEGTGSAARAAGADAYLRKPFSPLDLLAVVEELAGGLYEGPFQVSDARPPEEQLIRYAEDARRLLELEQGQRALIQSAYRETVRALTSALEASDLGTNAHSHRVQRYAMELAWTVDPRLVEEPSVEYGFLLHDVGKIGIPDRILSKPGPLTEAERRVLETHVILGEQMLGGVALLQGAGLEVVRHHHERWDGDGYPDKLNGDDIPLPARIFSAADALDAMTSDRPYRTAISWDEAVVELLAQASNSTPRRRCPAGARAPPSPHPRRARTRRGGTCSLGRRPRGRVRCVRCPPGSFSGLRHPTLSPTAVGAAQSGASSSASSSHSSPPA